VKSQQTSRTTGI